MSVSIKYKGAEIASANTDITKTLKTSGKYCEGDIEIINTQDGGITPSGKITITENGTDIDVSQYALADVNVSGGDIDYMAMLPDTSDIFFALKPNENDDYFKLTKSGTVEIGTISDGIFTPTSTLTDGVVPAHNAPVFVRFTMSDENLGYYHIPDCYALKDNKTKTFAPTTTSYAYSPSNCDYHKITKAYSGSSATSYGFRGSGAKKIEYADMSYTFVNNVELFANTACEELILNGVSFSVKFGMLSNIKKATMKNWTWTGGALFNDGLANTSPLVEGIFAGWNVGSATNFNGLFSRCFFLETLDLSGWDMSNATQFNNQFTNLYSLTNFIATGTKLPPLTLDFSQSRKLTDSSLVNIANALVSGPHTISFYSERKTRLGTLMGTVSDGVFTADASGDTTLLDFITQTKGWTVA